MCDIGFEQALIRIDEIVKTMSDDQIGLSKALELFKEAAELIAFCNDTINTAELTVEEYKKKFVSEEEP